MTLNNLLRLAEGCALVTGEVWIPIICLSLLQDYLCHQHSASIEVILNFFVNETKGCPLLIFIFCSQSLTPCIPSKLPPKTMVVAWSVSGRNNSILKRAPSQKSEAVTRSLTPPFKGIHPYLPFFTECVT